MKNMFILFISICTLNCFAHGPYHRPCPPQHHYHHDWWGRGGCNFWPGFVGGLVGSTVYNACYNTRPTVTVVNNPAPVVVQTQPIVVQQPAPVVVTQPQPTVVVQRQQVWIPGHYVDQIQVNGSVIRVWVPGHYE